MTGLQVEGLTVSSVGGAVEIVRAVDLAVEAGEIVGLVGESGSGKTTLGLAIMGYVRRGLRISGGSVRIRGIDMVGRDARALRALRGSLVSYVPQDPAAALNPALRIGTQLRETLDAHGFGASGREREERVAEVLRDVLLPADPAYLRRYPHELSGGQQQRVVLAMAFACRPAVIVLDEPTTGLDVTTQAHVIATVRDLARSYGSAAVYVTHDLAVVSSLADRVAVMYSGSIVEEGPNAAVFETPAHPYTERLIAAVPHLDGREGLRGIPGGAPSPARRPPGCPFAPRCVMAIPDCDAGLPELAPAGGGTHRVRCIRSDDVRRAALPAASIAHPQGPAATPLLSVAGLDAGYGDVQVLHGVDLRIDAGECLALVGESGSGKTTLARVIAGLHAPLRGELRLGGELLPATTRERSVETLRRVQFVFQNPYSSLNPRRTAGESIGRSLAAGGAPRAEVRRRVGEMLELVALRPAYADRYPDQMSGGERQRVAIARALIAGPDLIVCDEITSALDVSVQATIVDLLRSLQHDLGLALLFVTHNLPLVRAIAARAAVMRRGEIVEEGPVGALIDAPAHPYTRELIASTPALGGVGLSNGVDAG